LTYFRKRFPFIFRLFAQLAPLFSDDLGYGRIRQAWMSAHYLSLLMLAIKDEGCGIVSTRHWSLDSLLTITRSWDLWLRLAETELASIDLSGTGW